MYTSIEEEIQRMCNKSLLENLPYNRTNKLHSKLDSCEIPLVPLSIMRDKEPRRIKDNESISYLRFALLSLSINLIFLKLVEPWERKICKYGSNTTGFNTCTDI